MTEEELKLNKFIHEKVMGRGCYHDWVYSGSFPYKCSRCDVELDIAGALANQEPLPDYCNDLNLIHEAEKMIPYNKEHLYFGKVCYRFYEAKRFCSMFPVFTATALQRAKAIYEVMK